MKEQFTEDREEWQKELEHCEEVYTDLEETKHRKADLNISRRREISKLQRKVATQ